MRRGTFVHVLLLGVLLVLPILAHASPTDPTWIPGFYDDNDYDDVILFISGAVTAVDSRIADPIAIIAVCLGLIVLGGRPAAAHPIRSRSTRAPPQSAS
jgi:hypothetical protein